MQQGGHSVWPWTGTRLLICQPTRAARSSRRSAPYLMLKQRLQRTWFGRRSLCGTRWSELGGSSILGAGASSVTSSRASWRSFGRVRLAGRSGGAHCAEASQHPQKIPSGLMLSANSAKSMFARGRFATIGSTSDGIDRNVATDLPIQFVEVHEQHRLIPHRLRVRHRDLAEVVLACERCQLLGREDWLLKTLGVSATDPARYAWEAVAPGDPDHMDNTRRQLHAVADRARWQAALNEARRRAAMPPDSGLPAAGKAA